MKSAKRHFVCRIESWHSWCDDLSFILLHIPTHDFAFGQTSRPNSSPRHRDNLTATLFPWRCDEAPLLLLLSRHVLYATILRFPRSLYRVQPKRQNLLVPAGIDAYQSLRSVDLTQPYAPRFMLPLARKCETGGKRHRWEETENAILPNEPSMLPPSPRNPCGRSDSPRTSR